MSGPRLRPALEEVSLGAFAGLVTLVALLSIAALAVGFAGGGLAADNPGLLDFDPAETAADPGDTVTVDVTLAAMGGYDDDGVRSFEYTVAYDTQHLAVTDVETGPWMYQENETEVVTETTLDEDGDDDVGRLTVEQAREPPAGGVSDVGETPTATITFAVDEDAPPADAVVQFEDAEAELLEFPLPVLTSRELVIAVDGGGERYAPLNDPESDSDGPGVTLAEESAETESGESRIGTPVAVIGGIFAVLVVLAVQRRR